MLTINEINGWSLEKCNDELGAACHYSLHNDVSEAREACIHMAREMGMLPKVPESITVYWDNQDKQNEGWAYRVKYPKGREESGAVADSHTLEHAIASVCWLLALPGIEPDFAICQEEGGCAIWTASEDA